MEPVQYKDFRDSKFISFDLETYDPNLKELGSGEFRKDGYILGYSLGDETGFKEYYNIGHDDCTERERAKNLAYLAEVMQCPGAKLGVNFAYDVNWTEVSLGIRVQGKLIDIINSEALLDENLPGYSLDAMAHKYFGIGKSSSIPERICEERGWTGDFRVHLYKMTYDEVREYGRGDAEIPIKIFKVQERLMAAQDLTRAFDLECVITRMICDIHQRGCRINEKERDKQIPIVACKLEEMKKDFEKKYGKINLNSPKQVERLLTDMGAKFEVFHDVTDAAKARAAKKGLDEPEVGSPVLDETALDHLAEKYPVCNEIVKIKKLDKMFSTFLTGSLVKTVCPDGRIHAQFYNTKTENDGALRGTRSGRFSSALPNLQQLPGYDKKEKDEFRKWYTYICRSLFMPEEGCSWAKLDYAQLEFRTIANYAVNGLNDTSADDVRELFQQNPHSDFHQFIMDITGLPRRPAKTISFGVAFGLGIKKMAYKNNWTLDYTQEVNGIYHAKVPFMKATMRAVEIRAKHQGFIRLLDGRRSRLIDPKKSYIMFNRLAQGTGAVIAKLGMASAYQAGIFNELPLHLQVHDELDVSVPHTKRALEALRELAHHMENASLNSAIYGDFTDMRTPLKVPLIAEPAIGENWASVVDMSYDDMAKYMGL